jgi:hypothetical protein
MIRTVIQNLRSFLVGAIREGTTVALPHSPPSGHVLMMRFAAAQSLLSDGTPIGDAARAVGVEPEELRRWLAYQRSPVSARIRRR